MRLSIHLLGVEVFAISSEPDYAPDDDCSRDLSGGTLASDRIDPGPTDVFLGFTNGREDE